MVLTISFLICTILYGTMYTKTRHVCSKASRVVYPCKWICERRYKHLRRHNYCIEGFFDVHCQPLNPSTIGYHNFKSACTMHRQGEINARKPRRVSFVSRGNSKFQRCSTRTVFCCNQRYPRNSSRSMSEQSLQKDVLEKENILTCTMMGIKSFLYIAMNSFVLIYMAKVTCMGFKVRRSKTMFQSMCRMIAIFVASLVPYFALCLCYHRIANARCVSHEHDRPHRVGRLNTSSFRKKCGVFGDVKNYDDEGKERGNKLWRYTFPILSTVWVKIWKFWIVLLYLMCVPIGEAINPGPNWPNVKGESSDFLWIGNANTGQLLNKEQHLSEWGQGVWTFSETSATERAIPTIRQRCISKGFNILFGASVAPQQKTTIMRGKAGGVATASSFPIKSYAYPMPQFLHDSTRYMDCVVQVNNHQSIYISTIYGVAGQNSAHPSSLTVDIFNQAAERALTYRGPAVICGDFNVPIESLEMWETLQSHGWFDTAAVDSIKFQRDVQPTSKHGLRHSYILMNRYMASSFHSCRTSAHFEFDSHPLLAASFNLKVMQELRKEWCLPKSFDTFLFDTSLIQEMTARVTERNADRFCAALESSNMDEAAKQFTLAVEEVFKNSAVDCEGSRITIPQGHFGRANGKPFKVRQSCVPCINPGRLGEFIPIISQMTSSLRYHTKQLRRITSLIGQVKAEMRNPCERSKQQCQELWNKILYAQGFRKGFATWISDNLQCVVPKNTPDLEYLEEIAESFKKFHNNNLQAHYLANCSKAKIDLEIDIQKGGTRCFREVRDLPKPPLDAIHWTEECEILRVAWSKNGKSTVPVRSKPNFDTEYPIEFQGQKRYIKGMTSHGVILDAPVTLKNSHDPKIKQEKSSARPSDMHVQLEKFWSSLWQRDRKSNNPEDAEHEWDEAISFITCLNDCPSCNYRPISHALWFASLKGVKVKSARGADGFSTKDFHLITNQLLDWLLRIIEHIENGAVWPQQWNMSKVTALGKGSKPKSPLDIRPITILPKVYRLWSRLRSLEVLQHLKGIMPAEISATAGGVSADQIASYTACILEESRGKDEQVCGLIVDLIKCYNTIPWEPCKRLLSHIGIPLEYQRPFFMFMENLKRAFEVHGHCGELIGCTTGVPEGCAMSVAIMSALSWWCYAAMKHHHNNIITIAYADNWGLLADNVDLLHQGTTTMFRFVNALKMKISMAKSWFWGSNANIRKSLKNAPASLSEIPIVLHAVDLGCDQSYSRKKVCAKQRERFDKARRVLKRISKKTIPKRFRPTITQSAGFSVISYGIEMNYIPESTWSKLRTSTAGALNRNSAGANPYLACCFHSTPVDPQLKAIIKTLMYWRRFFRLFPGLRGPFLSNMLEQRNAGPAANLAKSLRVIGGESLPAGDIVFSNGLKINWTECSASFLKKIFKMYWTKHIATRIQHRKDFDVDSCDEFNMCNNIKHFSERQKAILIAYFCGAAFTADITSKYSGSEDNACKHCGRPDSRVHRLIHCRKLADTRYPDQDVIHWVKTKSDAWKQLAIMPMNEGILPILCIHQLHFAENNIPVQNNNKIDVFCDGSSYFQDQPTCTIAGAAAITTKENGEIESVVAAQPMPGVDHNSFRAECFAILLVMQKIYRPRIYSDCQSAVDQLNLLIEQYNQDLPPIYGDHHDIWCQIWEQKVQDLKVSSKSSKQKHIVTLIKLKAPI